MTAVHDEYGLMAGLHNSVVSLNRMGEVLNVLFRQRQPVPIRLRIFGFPLQMHPHQHLLLFPILPFHRREDRRPAVARLRVEVVFYRLFSLEVFPLSLLG